MSDRAIADRKYRQSEKGRLCVNRYNHSEKGLACQERFLDRVIDTPDMRQARIDKSRRWRENNQSTYQKVRREVLSYLGNKCSKCGVDDFRVLQIDHVNGNGYRERKQFGEGGASTVRYYRHILEVEGQGYQLLCANCNWIKRYEQEESS